MVSDSIVSNEISTDLIPSDEETVWLDSNMDAQPKKSVQGKDLEELKSEGTSSSKVRFMVIFLLVLIVACGIVFLTRGCGNSASSDKTNFVSADSDTVMIGDSMSYENTSDNDISDEPMMELKQKDYSASSVAKNSNERVYDVVEQMPSFPGGQSALMAYLASKIVYPVLARENGIQGRVVVKFIVEADGSITIAGVVRSVNSSLDKEALRVVKSMPKWNPGKQNGEYVRVAYTVPIVFRLQ